MKKAIFKNLEILKEALRKTVFIYMWVTCFYSAYMFNLGGITEFILYGGIITVVLMFFVSKQFKKKVWEIE